MDTRNNPRGKTTTTINKELKRAVRRRKEAEEQAKLDRAELHRYRKLIQTCRDVCSGKSSVLDLDVKLEELGLWTVGRPDLNRDIKKDTKHGQRTKEAMEAKKERVRQLGDQRGMPLKNWHKRKREEEKRKQEFRPYNFLDEWELV